jgi:hypothetical protein
LTHGRPQHADVDGHGGSGNAQFGTDLAQGLALVVQVGRTLNVHRVTVTNLKRIGGTRLPPEYNSTDLARPGQTAAMAACVLLKTHCRPARAPGSSRLVRSDYASSEQMSLVGPDEVTISNSLAAVAVNTTRPS